MLDGRGQLPQLTPERIGELLRFQHAAVGIRMLFVPQAQLLEEFVTAVMAAQDLLLSALQLVMDQESLVGPVVVELVEDPFDLAGRDADTQVIGRHGFDRVRLVEDHDLVVGQNLGTLLAQRQIAEEQRVVDDQDLRIVHAASRAIVEALAVMRALASQAVAAVARHFVPHRARWAEMSDRSRNHRTIARPNA